MNASTTTTSTIASSTHHHSAPLAAMSQPRRVTTHPAPTLLVYSRYLLQSGFRTAAIWTAGLAGYLVAMILSFRQIAPAISTTSYPTGLARAFDVHDMQTITGFLSAEVFSFVPLCIAIFPLLTMAGALAGAEERSRLDVLLGTPLSRRDLVLARALSMAGFIIAMLVVTATLGWIAAVVVNEDLPASSIFRAMLALAPFMAFFGGIGLLCSALTHRFATAIGIGLGILLVMYVADLIGKIVQDDRLSRVSAFHYYGSPLNDGVNWAGAIGMIAVAVAMVAAAVVAFQRRDIYS